MQFLWQQEQDSNLMTPWIRIAQPHGGNDKGFYFIPEIDEEVMVGFENGNAEKPYVIGTLYHGQAKSPESWYSDEDDIKAIRTRSGHTIEFHDTQGKEQIKIYDNEKNNFELTFSTHEQLIKLQSKGNIEFHADKDIVFDAVENVTIKAGKNISETADADITVDAGSNVSTKAGENITVDAGKNITIDAGKNMETSVGDNNTLNVGKDQTISVVGDKTENISKKYQLKAQNIREDASEKLQLYSQTHEQKSDSMKLEGGNKMDIKASSVKLN